MSNLVPQIELGAAPRKTAGTVTGNATAGAGYHTPVDATAGAVTITLPTGKKTGSHLSIEKVDATANTVTVTGMIRGTTASISLAYRYETLELIAESSTSWRVVSNHLPKSSIDGIVAGLLAAGTGQAATQLSATYVALPPGGQDGQVLGLVNGAIAWITPSSGAGAVVTTVNGDGFLSVTGSGVVDNGNGFITLTDSSVTDNGDGYVALAA